MLLFLININDIDDSMLKKYNNFYIITACVFSWLKCQTYR